MSPEGVSSKLTDTMFIQVLVNGTVNLRTGFLFCSFSVRYSTDKSFIFH